MKKIFSILVLISLSLAIAASSYASFDDISVSAHSAILINAGDGSVLYEKNPDERMLIASTTKIMTAVIVLENCDLDDIVTVPAEASGVEGSSSYLAAGEKLTVRELLYAIMLQSGNDAAAALAIHTSGSIEAFAEKMNEKAQGLGLENTSFKNPHGLDADGHYSTARDMAELTAYALENKDFKDISSTISAEVGSRKLKNHNRLLWELDGAIGVKTGYTMAAGRTLVSAAERNGLRFICVTLDDPDDWNDHKNLYETAYSDYELREMCVQGDTAAALPVISGESPEVPVIYGNTVKIMCEKGKEIETVVQLPEFVYAEVEKGGIAGKVTYFSDGKEIGSSDLLYGETIAMDDDVRLSFGEKILRILRMSFKYGGGVSYDG